MFCPLKFFMHKTCKSEFSRCSKLFKHALVFGSIHQNENNLKSQYNTPSKRLIFRASQINVHPVLEVNTQAFSHKKNINKIQ